MLYCMFDTETTGTTARDEVIQFSAIIANENLGIVHSINKYCNSVQPIHPQAYEAHRIDKQMLIERSEQKFFEDIVRTESIFQEPDVTFISYNIAFDTRMCNQTLMNNGHYPINFGDRVSVLRSRTKTGKYSFDMMRIAGQLFGNGYNIPLQTAATRAGFSLEDAKRAFSNYTGFSDNTRTHTHDGLFDAFLLFGLVSKTKGLIFHG